MPLPHFQTTMKSNSRKAKSGKFRWKLWIRRLFIFGLFAFVIGVIFVVAAFAWFSRDLPDPNKIMDRDIAQSTQIYDRTGETVLYEVHGEEKRTLVPLEEIPNTVKWATIAIEDKEFYQHHGFSYTGVLRAVLFGGSRGGGSTITQQFVKNAILTSERTFTRKVKELILAYQLEKKFTKDQILQMYLNEIPYGSVSYGIASASQTFLGKDVRELNLAESALLASLPQRPSFYSPYGSHLDELYGRQHMVLDKMAEQGYISKEEAEQAKQQEIVFVQKTESITAPHFVMYVKEVLSEKYGEKKLEEGLKVITTLDLDKQKIAEDAVRNAVDNRGKEFGYSNAALVSLDPKTGQILAMVGSKDFFDTEIDGQVNVATRLRQPGSSLKPMVYAALFEKGFSPESILFDAVTTFKTEGTQPYTPHNYDNSARGPVSIRKALAGSLNIPAVKALYIVGKDRAIDLFEKFGYQSFADRGRFGLALVLGGGEVKLLDHATAYAVFANEGQYVPSTPILRIEDGHGQLIEEFEQPTPRDVLDKNIARMINSILSDNEARAYVFGAQNNLNLGSRPVAAKTGTTNDYRDGWTMGYTPNLVAGVWVGNNDNSEMNRAGGSIGAAPIWHEYMSEATVDLPAEGFNSYVKPKTDKPILNGSYTGEVMVKVDKYSGKLATEYTPPQAIEERTYMDYHCELHYINPNDPLGPAPTKDNLDPAYGAWEAGVQSWLEAKVKKAEEEGKELVIAKPPTEPDDVHQPESRPVVKFISPTAGQTVTNTNLTAQISVSAFRRITKVEYYLDGNYISTSFNHPYGLSYAIDSRVANGYHNLKAIAYDDVENSGEAAIDINLVVERPAPSMTWMFPLGGSTYKSDNFPIVVKGRLTDLGQTKEVKFYYNNNEIGSVGNPDSATVFVSWGVFPGAGSYALSAKIIDFAGVEANISGPTIKLE
ncbi:MAG: penicillin-binding protein [Patescibacteria group bacterium]